MLARLARLARQRDAEWATAMWDHPQQPPAINALDCMTAILILLEPPLERRKYIRPTAFGESDGFALHPVLCVATLRSLRLLHSRIQGLQVAGIYGLPVMRCWLSSQ
jgi:hypothetical protein